MNRKMMTLTSFELFLVCIKKLGQFFSILYSLYIVLFQVINILKVTFENIGLRFFKNTIYTHDPFIKVIKF